MWKPLWNRWSGSWWWLRRWRTANRRRDGAAPRAHSIDCVELEERVLLSATPLGAETLVNTTTSGAQTTISGANADTHQSVAADGSGNFVVTWTGTDATGKGVFAQRFDSSGNALGSEFQVNTTTTADQQDAVVSMNSTGQFVIAWSDHSSGNWDIRAQMYDASGNAVGGEILVNSTTTDDQQYPTVAVADDGDFIVAWQSNNQDGSGWGIYAQEFKNDGTLNGAEFLVNTATADSQTNPAIAIDASNGYVITWQSNNQDGNGWGIYGQQYLKGSGAQGGEFQINTTTANDQEFAGVAKDAAGAFVVTWSSNTQDGDTWGVYAQRYDSSGVAQGAEFRVNSTTQHEQEFSNVALDASGNFVVTWSSKSQDQGGGWGVYMKQFDATGAVVTPETLVNMTTTGDQDYSSVADLGGGQFVVDWSGRGSGDTQGVFFQRYQDAFNQAPVNSVPGVQTTNEDTPLVFSTANSNLISISDPDAGSNPVQVTLTATNGMLTLAGTTNLTFTVGTGTGDTTMTFTGAISDINTALDGMSFTPTADYNGAASVQITTNDQGYSGSGGAMSDTDTVNVTVNAVNDPPVNSVPAAVATLVDMPIVFSATNGNGISISDVDAGSNPLQITLTATNGTLTLAGITGLSFTSGSGSNDTTMTFTGTLTDINTALDGMQYTPTSGYSGTASITLTSNDQGSSGAGGAQSATDTIAVQMITNAATRVNTTVAANQHEAAIAMDSVGNYVVVWTSDNQDGGGKGVYAQLFNSSGNKVGSEFRVNTTTASDQNQPAVAMDANGNFVVTWVSNNQDGDKKGIYAQRFDSSGNTLGSEFRVNTLTTGTQDNTGIAMDASGDFVIVWRTDQGNNVKAQRFNSAGVAQGSEFRVNTNTTETEDQPQVAMDASGNFTVVWRSTKQDGSGAGVFGQRYDAAGVALGTEFQVNTTNSGDQNRPYIAMDSTGDFVVTWTSGNNQDGAGRGIFGQRFNASGVKQGGEFQVNTYTPSNQDWSGVAMDASGNFFVAWMSNGQDGDKNGVYAQEFAADGTTIGGEFLVNASTVGDQKNPAIAASAEGDFAIAWEGNGVGDSQGVFERYYAHTNMTPVNTVPGAQSTNEDTNLVFSSANGNQISISDQDAEGNVEQVTLTATNGMLTLAGVTGLTFTSGSNGSASMTFTGTIANINTALNGLTFSPTANYNGAASVQIDTNDLGNTGLGGAKTDSDTVNITVVAVNDAPVNTVPGAQVTNEDTVLVFSSGNGNQISISDIDAGSSPVQVTLAMSPGSGTLTLNGTTGLTFSIGTGTNDTTVQFTGTIANINAALNGLIYTPAANFNGAAGLGMVTNDQGNTGSGGAQSANSGVSITVNAVDDAPVNTVPGAQNINEDTSLVFSSGNGNQITIADVDAGSNPVQVTLTVNNGTLTLNGTTGLTFTSGTGTGDASMTFTGTMANINTALNGLVYQPAANFNGTDILQVLTNDQGNSGSGGPLTNSQSVPINVFGVNDPPVNSVPGPQTTNEDTTLVFSSGNGNAISISDVDAGSNPVQVTLTATNGTLTLNGIAGLTFNSGTGTGDATMTFTGTIANINAALDGLTYSPTANFNGPATLSITTNDQGNSGAGGSQLDSDTVNITVNAVDDAPVNTVPGTQATNEDTPLVFSSGNGNQISIADLDAGSNPVRVTLSVSNGTLTLNGTTGLTFTSGTGSGDALMTFTGTIANINAALNGLTYQPTANYNGTDTLHLLTNDQGNTGSGGPLTDSSFVSINVNSVNDPPVNTVPGAQATNEDTSLVFSSANGNPISIADPDAGSNPVQVTLSVSNGSLTLSGTTGLTFTTGSGAGDATMTFTGTLANINAALDGLTYQPASNYNGADALSIVTDDLGNTGGPAQSDSSSVAITVNAVNDAPVNTVPIAQVINEDTALVFSAANGNQISIADLDAGNSPVQVTLTVSNGTLTLAGTTGLTFTTGTGAGDTTMTFTGTLTDINTALDGLTYQPAANYNGTDALQVLTDDQGNTGSGGPLTDFSFVSINVNAVNDAPVDTVPGPQTTNEDMPLVFSTANGNAINVSDPDAGTSPVEVTLTVTDGTLTLAGTTGLTFTTGTGVGDASMTFTGTLVDINAALDGLTYNPSSNFNGGATLQVVTNDLGNNGSGGMLMASNTVAITVSPVNDAPTEVLPGTQTTPFATNIVFSTANGNAISVQDVDAGNNPIQVTLTATNGTLTLAGTTGLTFTSGSGVGDASMTFSGTLADVNAALDGLTFRPVSTYRGPATMQMDVDDLGNQGAGGPLTASGAVNLTIQPAAQRILLLVPGGQTADQFSVVFSSGNNNAIVILDAYAENGQVEVRLETTNGTLALSNTTGLTMISGGSGPSQVLEFRGTISDVNAALNGLALQTDVASATVSATVTDTARDGTGPQTVSGAVPVQQAIIYPAPPAPSPIINVAAVDITKLPVSIDILRQTTPQAIPQTVAPPPATVYAPRVHRGPAVTTYSTGSDFVETLKPPKLAAAPVDVAMATSTARSFENGAAKAAPPAASPLEALAVEIQWNQIEQVLKNLQLDSPYQTLVVGAAGTTVALSAGYVLWSLQTTSLVASLLSSLPAWRSFDPLPVLEFWERKHRNDEDENDDADDLLSRTKALQTA